MATPANVGQSQSWANPQKAGLMSPTQASKLAELDGKVSSIIVSANQAITAATNAAAAALASTSVAGLTKLSVQPAITGNPIAVGDNDPRVQPTGVVPGAYTNLNATLDAYGRVTAAANGTSGIALITEQFPGDGTTVAFPLTGTPLGDVFVTVGVAQSVAYYSVAGAVVTLTFAPGVGDLVTVTYLLGSVTQMYNDQFDGDGTTTAFTLTKTPSGASPAGVFVTDGGVPQAKANFSYSGTTFTMGYAPLSGNLVTICYIA